MADINQLLDELVSGNGGRGHNDQQGNQGVINLLLQNYLQGNSSNNRLESIVSAPRTDAYGNKISYDPVNGWTTTVTPTTKSILDAKQGEDLMSLTRDAPRNRAAAERQDSRSVQGADAFEEAFNNYRYRPQKTEQDYIGDAQRDLTLDRSQGLDDAAALRSRQALRGGSANDFTAAFAPGADQGEFDGILNQGRRQGQQDFLNFEGGKDARSQKELQFYQGVADDTSNTPVVSPTIGQELDATGNNALGQLMSILQTNETSRSNNLNALVAAIQAQKDKKH